MPLVTLSSVPFQVTIQAPWLAGGQERSSPLHFSQPFSASARLATSGGRKFLELSLQQTATTTSMISQPPPSQQRGFTFFDPRVEVISPPGCSAELMGDEEDSWVRNTG